MKPNLNPKTKIFLAPMLEPNDIIFRKLCKKTGAGLTFTGMTSPLSKQKLILDDKPALQLFANSTKNLKQFIEKHDKKVSAWDFNLGCPSKLSKKLQHGAFLQKDFNTIKTILKEIRSSTKKLCTIKLRKSPNTIKIAKLAESLKFDAITIHPRTIEQGYSGEPDYEFAKNLKSKISLPIIYSGNVDEKNIEKVLKNFDFAMIGRAAIGNPNIFSKITNTKPIQEPFREYLKQLKKYPQPWKQIKYQAMVFTKHRKDAKNLRRQLISAKTIEDIEKIYKPSQSP